MLVKGTPDVSLHPYPQHIEAETKWMPFRRRYFEVQFVEWKSSCSTLCSSLKLQSPKHYPNWCCFIGNAIRSEVTHHNSSPVIMLGTNTKVNVFENHILKLSISPHCKKSRSHCTPWFTHWKKKWCLNNIEKVVTKHSLRVRERRVDTRRV